MVSLPVHVAGLQEAACLLQENINHLDSSYTQAWQLLPLKLQNPHNKDSERLEEDLKLHIMNIVLLSSTRLQLCILLALQSESNSEA